MDEDSEIELLPNPAVGDKVPRHVERPQARPALKAQGTPSRQSFRCMF
jgi:hypothetical protein